MGDYVQSKERKMIINLYGAITVNKDGLHKIKYVLEEQKGDATIKSTVSILLEDAEIFPHEPLENVIKKGADIAKQEYQKH